MNPHAPPWTYLFRSGTAFAAADATADGLLDGAPRQGERRALVGWRIGRDGLSAIDDYHGLVLFGPRGLSQRDLVAAGFRYVRRFALIPSPARARWLIPRDERRLGAAALRALATPYRLRSRVLAAGVSALLRLGVPLTSREVWIVAREEPPVHAALARILGTPPASLAVASRGWGNRQAPTFVAIGSDARPIAFVKLAASERSRMLISREAAILEALGARTAPRDLAPGLLFAGTIDGVYANVQTPVAGSPGPARLSAAHVRFLAALGGEPRDAASCELLRSIDERLPQASQGAWLGTIYREARDRLRGAALPRTIVHGDFAPFNLRVDRGRVAGFDWENGCLDGLPLVDAVHHELQVGFLLRDWKTKDAIRSLDRFTSERSRDGLSRERVRALQAAYLLDMYLRRIEDGHSEASPRTRRYIDLLRDVAGEIAA